MRIRKDQNQLERKRKTNEGLEMLPDWCKDQETYDKFLTKIKAIPDHKELERLVELNNAMISLGGFSYIDQSFRVYGTEIMDVILKKGTIVEVSGGFFKLEEDTCAKINQDIIKITRVAPFVSLID